VHKGEVERLVLALELRCDRQARGGFRLGAEDRRVAVDDPNLRLFREDLGIFVGVRPADGALVIDEIDDGDVVCPFRSDRRDSWLEEIGLGDFRGRGSGRENGGSDQRCGREEQGEGGEAA
jgi:hypothetical protein